MSFLDDTFDVEAALKGMPEAKQFDQILERVQSDWRKASEHKPADMQEVIFIVSSRDDHYDGRMLGGRYLERHNEYTVPGMSFSASYWMPMPPPPAPIKNNLTADKSVIFNGGYCDPSCPFLKTLDPNNLNAICEKDDKPIKWFDGFNAHCI